MQRVSGPPPMPTPSQCPSPSGRVLRGGAAKAPPHPRSRQRLHDARRCPLRPNPTSLALPHQMGTASTGTAGAPLSAPVGYVRCARRSPDDRWSLALRTRNKEGLRRRCKSLYASVSLSPSLRFRREPTTVADTRVGAAGSPLSAHFSRTPHPRSATARGGSGGRPLRRARSGRRHRSCRSPPPSRPYACRAVVRLGGGRNAASTPAGLRSAPGPPTRPTPPALFRRDPAPLPASDAWARRGEGSILSAEPPSPLPLRHAPLLLNTRSTRHAPTQTDRRGLAAAPTRARAPHRSYASNAPRPRHGRPRTPSAEPSATDHAQRSRQACPPRHQPRSPAPAPKSDSPEHHAARFLCPSLALPHPTNALPPQHQRESLQQIRASTAATPIMSTPRTRVGLARRAGRPSPASTNKIKR